MTEPEYLLAYPAILPRLLDMWHQACREGRNRTLTEWRLSPDLYDRLAGVWPERPGWIVGLPVRRDEKLPPNGVVLA